jgi:hypothetical protein
MIKILDHMINFLQNYAVQGKARATQTLRDHWEEHA